MSRRLILGLAAALVVVLLALWLWPSEPALQSDLTRLQQLLDHGQGWRDRNPRLAVAAYLGIFMLAGALPLPVVVAMTLAGGAFFGFWLGLVLSLAGTVAAAMLTFLAARHLLTRPARRLLGRRAEQMDRLVLTDGTLALLSLRLTPALPFFVLNMAAGISRLPARAFVWITALGVLPNKAILTGAGTQLTEIERVSDLFGPRVIAILAALTLFPWLARAITRRWRPDAPRTAPAPEIPEPRR